MGEKPNSDFRCATVDLFVGPEPKAFSKRFVISVMPLTTYDTNETLPHVIIMTHIFVPSVGWSHAVDLDMTFPVQSIASVQAGLSMIANSLTPSTSPGDN